MKHDSPAAATPLARTRLMAMVRVLPASLTLVTGALLGCTAALAQAPGATPSPQPFDPQLSWDDHDSFSWRSVPGATRYVLSGTLTALRVNAASPFCVRPLADDTRSITLNEQLAADALSFRVELPAAPAPDTWFVSSVSVGIQAFDSSGSPIAGGFIGRAAETVCAAAVTATVVPFPTAASALLSIDSSLAGSVIQDAAADSVIGAGDEGASTLVELISFASDGRGGFSLMSDASGAFVFKGIPAGEYVLFVWWGPGFIGVPTTPTNDGLYWTGISVSDDGTVRGELPRQLLVKPNTSGAIPFPVRTGGGDLPVGTLQIGAAPAAPRALPPTGSGETDTWWPVLAGAAALLLGAAGTTALALRRRSR